MALITLRILDGADRGRAFVDVPTPMTIGREEGNSVQLNDERISRFHLKIQEDNERIVLTDLQSTNGSKVNGENVQLSILRPGDIIAVGRTVLVFGSREDVARRLAALRGADLSAGVPLNAEEDDDEDVDLAGSSGAGSSSISLEFELNYADTPDAQATLHTLAPPELPENLSPGQAAQLAELLQYVHLRIRGMVGTVKGEPDSERVTLQQRQWQNLVDLHDRVAAYLRAIGEPGE